MRDNRQSAGSLNPFVNISGTRYHQKFFIYFELAHQLQWWLNFLGISEVIFVKHFTLFETVFL